MWGVCSKKKKKNNDPTLDVASRFLSQPANQELKFLIEGKIKD